MNSQVAVEELDRRTPGSLGARVLATFGAGGLLLAAGIAAVVGLTAPHGSATSNSQPAAIRAIVASELAHDRSPPVLRALERGVSAGGTTVRLVSGKGRTTVATSSFGSYANHPLRLAFGMSAAAAATPTARTVVTILAAGCGLLALLLCVGTLIVRRAIETPLRRLRYAIERTAAGVYGEPIEIGGSPELRATGEALAALAGRVAELEGQATTDALTGAANRRFFLKALDVEVQRAARQRSTLSLALLDLDGFKTINDSRGHPFGDAILRKVSERIRSTLRATDVLARIGGDEFALLLPATTSDQARAAAERAQRALGGCFGDLELSWCVGVASYPHDAPDGTKLVECADAALYCAKGGGHSSVYAYDPGKFADGARVNDDHRAITALLKHPDAVVPVFQPLVSLVSGEVAGYEALARFPHPPARRPDEWFAIAHRCELGPALEARAVRAALSVPGRPAGSYLSFNLSASALGSETVLAALPTDLSDVVIEITENQQVLDQGRLAEQLAPLRERGARIAVDDAGAGYSGLQQVMRLEPDIIKLDRSLVADLDRDPAKAALIDAFVRFARRTGALVCAEGIETPEELKLLCDLDVAYGQGFGLARPAAPWASVPEWVAGTIHSRVPHRGAPASESEPSENADTRLAQISARVADATDPSQLGVLATTIASELGADEVALLRLTEDSSALDPITANGWLRAGQPLALSNYPSLAQVVSSREALQVLAGDSGADLGELALLGRSKHASMVLAPVVMLGQLVGVLAALTDAERRWTRSEVSRTRVVAYQLGSLVSNAPAARLKPLAHVDEFELPTLWPPSIAEPTP